MTRGITVRNPQSARIAAEATGRILGLFASPIEGATMSRERQEQIVDIGQYAIGGPLFFGVAAVTSAVMLVGFVAIEGVDRLIHH